MPTEQITITCTNNKVETDNTCIVEMSDFYTDNVSVFATPFFSAGEFFIGLELLILIVLGIIILTARGIFSVGLFKKYLGVNQQEGKEIYKI